MSDHAFVVADCVCPSPLDESTSHRTVRNWRSLDIDAFAADLHMSALVVSPPEDVDAAFACYDTTLRSLLDKHAPLELKRIRTRSSARWYDSECHDAKRATRKLERKYRQLRTAESLTAWKRQFSIQRQLYESKFTAFWTTTIERIDSCRRNPRKLWRTVNELLQPPVTTTSEKLSAEDFATFFRYKVANIRATTASADPPDISARPVPPLTSFEPVTEKEIQTLLSNSPAKSCSVDPIPTWLLKQLSVHIVPVICFLCNLSLRTGTFPPALKHALVHPRIKKPTLDPEVANHYRPISNLPYISKLVERVIARRFISHATEFNLFPPKQSAYRQFHSTETAVLSVHNDIVRAVDNKELSLLVLLDLSAAFDTVDHHILLNVLENRFSIQGTALNWFCSYFTDRTQSFVLGDSTTDAYTVDCSVPQGSVLGPLSFVAYTDDIGDVVERQHGVSLHQYADDKQLFASAKIHRIADLRRQLGDCVVDVRKWCASRRLQLNADKTEAIWFGSRASISKLSSQDRTLAIGETTINTTDVVRNLGVHLDSELSMKQHVAKVASVCFYHIRRLRQIRRRVGQEVTTRLVLAMITSRLDYCNSLLAGLPQSTLEPLQRVQNSAARLIFNLRQRDHVTPALQQLHWLPIQARVQFKLCVLMYGIHNRQCPAYLSNAVQSVAATSTRGLRSATSTNYVTPRLRSKFGERAFSHAGPAAWNRLPETVRQAQSLAHFKKLLKSFLFIQFL